MLGPIAAAVAGNRARPRINGTRMSQRSAPSSGLLTLRTAFVLLLALLAASAATGLTWLSRHNVAEAALAGLAVLGGGIRFFDWLIS